MRRPIIWLLAIVATVSFLVVAMAATADRAYAQPAEPPITAPIPPAINPPSPGVSVPFNEPSAPTPGNSGDQLVNITVGNGEGATAQSLILVVGLGLLSLAPSLVIMLSSFTRIVIVLSLTRNALGLQGVPPNQVITGLALFLSLFVMGPTLSQINDDAIQPYMNGQMTQSEAFDAASAPIRSFMLAQEPDDELAMILSAQNLEQPESVEDISLSSIVPAFLLSELKSAFIIGMVIFIPFVIIDLVVAAVLMSLGMMMLPPVFVSLPFKLLLFVMVGGWSLVVETLLASYAL